MCRWFAYLSPRSPASSKMSLITPKHSLSQQVNHHYLPKLLSHPPNPTEAHEIDARNRLFNIDGLGIAWYTPAQSSFVRHLSGVRPATFKTIAGAPARDQNLVSICRNTETKALFAHVQAATATATSEVNNHPFVFGRHAVMHNGVIAGFAGIRRGMCEVLSPEAYEAIQGTTDSEHLAALYVTYLTAGEEEHGEKKGKKLVGKDRWEEGYSVKEMDRALYRAFETVVELQRKILGDKAEPSSLNVAVTNGESLVCYRFRNHRTEQPPSLYYSTKAGVTLNRKYPDHADGPAAEKKQRQEQQHKQPGAGERKDPEHHGEHIIVSSEPTTYREQDWEVVPKNGKVLVEKSIDSLVVEDIGVPDSWNYEDITGTY